MKVFITSRSGSSSSSSYSSARRGPTQSQGAPIPIYWVHNRSPWLSSATTAFTAKIAANTAKIAANAGATKMRMELLSRRQHHHHLAALKARLLLDLGDLGGVVLDTVEQLVAQLLVRHFPAAEAQRHLDLVAFLEEALHRAHLHVVIVIVDHRPEFYLLDLDHFLFLAGFSRLLLRLVFVFAVVEKFGNGRD